MPKRYLYPLAAIAVSVAVLFIIGLRHDVEATLVMTAISTVIVSIAAGAIMMTD